MKLQWLKFDIDFFNDEKIRLILEKPSGESIILIWVRMLCLAMKSARPGLIEIRDGVPYEIDELASVFNIKATILSAALKLFLRLGMIDVHEGSPIEIVNFLSWQNIEAIEKKRLLANARVRNFREKRRKKPPCNANVTPCNADRLDQNRLEKKEDQEEESQPIGCKCWDWFYTYHKDKELLPLKGDKKGCTIFYKHEKDRCMELEQKFDPRVIIRVWKACLNDSFWSKQRLSALKWGSYAPKFLDMAKWEVENIEEEG
jgi:predicted phage replisome organizer